MSFFESMKTVCFPFCVDIFCLMRLNRAEFSRKKATAKRFFLFSCNFRSLFSLFFVFNLWVLSFLFISPTKKNRNRDGAESVAWRISKEALDQSVKYGHFACALIWSRFYNQQLLCFRSSKRTKLIYNSTFCSYVFNNNVHTQHTHFALVTLK